MLSHLVKHQKTSHNNTYDMNIHRFRRDSRILHRIFFLMECTIRHERIWTERKGFGLCFEQSCLVFVRKCLEVHDHHEFWPKLYLLHCVHIRNFLHRRRLDSLWNCRRPPIGGYMYRTCKCTHRPCMLLCVCVYIYNVI